MTRPIVLTSLLVASTVLVVSCSSPTAPAQSDASAEAEVSRQDAAEVEAFLANDPTALARLWSDAFVVTNPFNQFLDKQQVLALVTSGTLAFTAYQRHIDYVHVDGGVVFVAGRETVLWAGKIPLAGQTSQLRYTAAWARDGNNWREIARHASLVVPGGPSGPTSAP